MPNVFKIKPWEIVVVGAVAAYLLVLAFPYFLFRHEIVYKGCHIYSDAPIPGEISGILDKTLDKLGKSELYDPHRRYRIFISSSFFRYGSLAPFNRKAFAVTYPLTENIFLSKTDVGADSVSRSGGSRTRELNGVLAHELTHVAIRKTIGFWRSRFLPSWKEEGYCDYIAKESSFDIAQGIALLKERKSDNSSSFRYFKYRILVHYLMDSEKMGFGEMISKKFKKSELEKEAVGWFLKDAGRL